jgi:hypothetical protein
MFSPNTQLTGIAAAIEALYGVASDVNTFIDKHIDDMKNSSNTTISRSGRVLEGAKYGFGIGYIVPIAIIAIGQLILGNTFAAASTVASAAVLTNPIAMTCAALGALYYGWQALSEQEKNEIIDRVSNDLKIGAELIKAVVNFAITKSKELLSAENFKEIKEYVSSVAATFGKTLGDVSGAIRDHVTDAFETVKFSTGSAINAVTKKIKPKRL